MKRKDKLIIISGLLSIGVICTLPIHLFQAKLIGLILWLEILWMSGIGLTLFVYIKRMNHKEKKEFDKIKLIQKLWVTLIIIPYLLVREIKELVNIKQNH